MREALVDQLKGFVGSPTLNVKILMSDGTTKRAMVYEVSEDRAGRITIVVNEAAFDVLPFEPDGPDRNN